MEALVPSNAEPSYVCCERHLDSIVRASMYFPYILLWGWLGRYKNARSSIYSKGSGDKNPRGSIFVLFTAVYKPPPAPSCLQSTPRALNTCPFQRRSLYLYLKVDWNQSVLQKIILKFFIYFYFYFFHNPPPRPPKQAGLCFLPKLLLPLVYASPLST